VVLVHGDHVVELVAGYRIPWRCERLIDRNRLADADVPDQQSRRLSSPRPRLPQLAEAVSQSPSGWAVAVAGGWAVRSGPALKEAVITARAV
jgi:hypothetical protein